MLRSHSRRRRPPARRSVCPARCAGRRPRAPGFRSRKRNRRRALRRCVRSRVVAARVVAARSRSAPIRSAHRNGSAASAAPLPPAIRRHTNRSRCGLQDSACAFPARRNARAGSAPARRCRVHCAGIRSVRIPPRVRRCLRSTRSPARNHRGRRASPSSPRRARRCRGARPESPRSPDRSFRSCGRRARAGCGRPTGPAVSGSNSCGVIRTWIFRKYRRAHSRSRGGMASVYSSASDRGGDAVHVFVELRRRNVFRAATLYAAAAWLVVQVATQVLPVYGAPNWMLRVIVLAAVIGFPFVLAFAWYYELTPEGLKREHEVPREKSIAHLTGKKLDRAIIAVLSVIVVLLLVNTFVFHRGAAGVPDKSVAVLPLLNESGSADDQYFSDGLSEELISELTQIGGLKVIGRNSSFRFRQSNVTLKAIGAQLGVATLLEGSVRKQGGRVRIVTNLVNVADGRELWAQTYDRDIKDIFDVKSEIARSVADALKARWFGASGEAGDKPPSGNLDAYGAFLQGGFFFARGGETNERRAIDYYEQATKLDPDYALAHVRLATTLTSYAAQYLGGPEAAQAYARARAAVGRALVLAPDLAESHIAFGALLNTADFDQTGAVREFRRALQLAPNSAEAKAALALQLATLGQLKDAEALLREALGNDPLHASWLVALAQLDDAAATIRKAIALQPGASYNHVLLTIIDVRRNAAATALKDAQSEPRGPWQEIGRA